MTISNICMAWSRTIFLSRDRHGQTKDACVVCTTKYTRHLLSVGFIGCCRHGELQICHKLLTGLLHHMLWMMSPSSGLRCGRPICPFLSSNMGHLSGWECVCQQGKMFLFKTRNSIFVWTHTTSQVSTIGDIQYFNTYSTFWKINCRNKIKMSLKITPKVLVWKLMFS